MKKRTRNNDDDGEVRKKEIHVPPSRGRKRVSSSSSSCSSSSSSSSGKFFFKAGLSACLPVCPCMHNIFFYNFFKESDSRESRDNTLNTEEEEVVSTVVSKLEDRKKMSPNDHLIHKKERRLDEMQEMIEKIHVDQSRNHISPKDAVKEQEKLLPAFR